MKEKVWYEFTHAKYGDTYLALYLYEQRKRKKIFKISTLVLSTSGILGWKIWAFAPIIACAIIAVVQLFNLIENQIILSDNDLDKISELRNKYVEYANTLEKLFDDFLIGTITPEATSNEFYRLRAELGEEIEALDNKLHVHPIKAIEKKADTQTRNYIKQYHS